MGIYISPSEGQSLYINYLTFFAMDICPPPHLFIHSFNQYGLSLFYALGYKPFLFFWWYWDLNSGPCDSQVGTFLLETSSQSFSFQLFFKCIFALASPGHDSSVYTSCIAGITSTYHYTHLLLLRCSLTSFFQADLELWYSPFLLPKLGL
jgi:hypothetical protein